MELPDVATMAWAEATLGPFQVLSRFAHSHGYSRLWRLETDGGRVWLKMHAHPHKWAGEVHALTRWTLPLAPALLASRDEPCTVLLSEMPGEPNGTGARLWREAGAWLARLHQIENGWFGNVRVDGSPHDEPSFDAEAFLGAQWEARLVSGRASGLLQAHEIGFVEGAMRDGLPLFRGERPCAIHRDYTPRNWLAHPDGSLAAVIDFEHARWDVRAADLQRPWSREFLGDPSLAEAFYDGYGGLADLLRAQIATLRTVMALTTIVWATSVGDPGFAEEARADLRRLMARG